MAATKKNEMKAPIDQGQETPAPDHGTAVPDQETPVPELKKAPKRIRTARNDGKTPIDKANSGEEPFKDTDRFNSKVERERRMPIVGIGASAGGLEAFEKFFTPMPADSGMAFVLVQHLDPTHKSMLTELVKRYTEMDVFEVEDGMAVKANCTYIIPPNRDMAILHGKLLLMEPAAPRGLRLPIDSFFRSLAQDQGERAIGIVLSGTGTEGAQGIRAIKGEGGMAMVQNPATAKYDGMPRSAIATGMADYILAPQDMAQHLLAYVQHTFGEGSLKAIVPPAKSENDLLGKIFIILRAQTGHDFSYYKGNTINRRIARRMTVNQISRLEDYVHYLQQNSIEVETLFKELLIGVTHFFRDPEAWEALKAKVIPRIFEEHPPGQPVRVWVPGCSTGEEAYSIAILLQEYLDEQKSDAKVQVFATDIDNEAIEKARLGIYPESIAVDVLPERLRRFFSHEENTYQIKRSIRDLVVFALQNVIKDPPFSRLDLISCRNLLIYMQPELQKRILPLFNYALNQSGFLFLGNSESVGEYSELFANLDRKWKIFQCERTHRSLGQGYDLTPAQLVGGLGVPRKITLPKEGSARTMRELVERFLLKHYTPTSILINEKGNILYVHGSTGKYLELPSGEGILDILRMAREGLRLELATAVRKAMAQKLEVRYEGLQIRQNGHSVTANLTVSPGLDSPELKGLIMVILEEVPARGAADAPVVKKPRIPGERHISKLQRELEAKEEYLQTTLEELETSNEELKSTNEELQSANEELQSTNEELETSKEELQSVNEELVTVNVELQKKIEQLSHSNNDMNNLLASTEIGTVFLDTHLRIQRFTPAVTQIMPVIQSDIGRPIRDISTNLVYSNLAENVEAVLKTLIYKEIEVHSTTGLWYWMRIMPYRTLENVIEGVVVTFVNITNQKRAQHELVKLTRAVEQSKSIIMITNVDGEIEYINSRFTEVTGYAFLEIQGKTPRVLRSGKHAPEFYQKLWDTLKSGSTWQGEFHNRKKDGTLYWESASISPVKDESGQITHFIAVKEDLSERKHEDEKG